MFGAKVRLLNCEDLICSETGEKMVPRGGSALELLITTAFDPKPSIWQTYFEKPLS